MGLRYLLLILAIAGAVWIIRHLRRARPPESTPPVTGERMVRCAHCGVHLPESEALRRNDQYFCSRRHLEAGPNDAD